MNMTQKVIFEQGKLTLLVRGSPAYLNKHAAFSCSCLRASFVATRYQTFSGDSLKNNFLQSMLRSSHIIILTIATVHTLHILQKTSII